MALRQALHPPLGHRPTLKRPLLPIRVIVIGARGESSMPPAILQQITHLFPLSAPFHVYFIGPECHIPAWKGKEEKHVKVMTEADVGGWGCENWTKIVTPKLSVTNLKTTYEEVHEKFGQFDPYHDVFFAFSPGFGFPSCPTPDPALQDSPYSPTSPSPPQSTTIWHTPLLQILSTKCALFCTGFSPADVERDVRALEETDGVVGEFDWVLTPGENFFGSDRWEVLEPDPRVMVRTNWGVWGIKGKSYNVDKIR